MPPGPMMTRVQQTLALDEPVAKLPSAGGKRQQGLKRLGITTIRDLLCDYPFRYNDLSLIVPIAQASFAERSSVLGRVRDVKVKNPRPRLTVIEVALVDDSGLLIATWFNQPWMANVLKPGTRVILMGKVEHSYGFLRMSSPLHSVIDEQTSAGSILPVYHSNSQISAGWVSHCIDEALLRLPAPLDPLPASLRMEQGFMSRQSAWQNIHHPLTQASRNQARRRLAFEEVFMLQLYLKLRRQRQQAQASPHQHLTTGPTLKRLASLIPFTLTADQQTSIDQILDDMAAPQIMSRLLLGDVGSGKTIVAAFALAATCDSNTQAAMMAPTEVLAEQYAHKLGPLFDKANISWALLTSSTPQAARTQLLEGLAQGSICVLFGTHALIEPSVHFKNLSLIVIDEQHRFGVGQREALRAKGQGCDVLSMTATPIPRSLALTIYGDMDTSYLRSKPQSSTKTTTTLIDWQEIRLAYEAIREALSRGEQAYIVCPLIGGLDPQDKQGEDDPGNEDDQAEILITEFTRDLDPTHIQAAEQEVHFLQDKVFPQNHVGLLTSRLSSADKRKVMEDFRQGSIEILVSTTVIEVGIDVPNATVMVIEGADHFGLSQLHQLRGRVGRGSRDGQVFLVSSTQREQALARLSKMTRCSDGFELAEFDLKLRREGDILGNRQHGDALLKLVNVVNDAKLIALANKEAQKLLEADPLLQQPAHSHLAAEIELLFAAGFESQAASEAS